MRESLQAQRFHTARVKSGSAGRVDEWLGKPHPVRGNGNAGLAGFARTRPHLKQVVLGMVLDGDDRPFASFLWPGNTADVTRLMPVVQRLRERFGIAQVCVVADRGMISAATIAALEKAGLEYILGVRERSTKEVRTEVIEDDGVAVPLTIPRQKGETQLAIKETTLKGRRYVLCRNEEEARKDAERRAAILAGLERKLTHGDKALVSNKGFRRFVKAVASGNFSIDYDRVAADAKFDGLFVLRTNTRLSALQVVLRYRNLLAVEDVFKTAKALLTTRPIFHKTDAGIRGHVLAYSSDCSMFGRVAGGRRNDLRRLGVRTAVSLDNIRAHWNAIVPSMPMAA